MKPKVLLLVPWMVLVAAAHGQARSADILYSHHETIPVPAYRVGEECFVSLENAESWGWKASVKGAEADIEAEGQEVHVSLRSIGGRASFPLRKAVESLGGSSDWIPTTDTLVVYSTLKELTFKDGQLEAKSSLAFKPFTFFLSEPNRIVVDLAGVRLSPKTTLNLDPGAHAIQYRPNVVRVTLETKFVPEANSAPLGESRDFQYQPVPSKTVEQVEPTPPVVKSDTNPALGTLPISANSGNGGATELRIPLGGNLRSAPTYSKPDPTTLEIVLHSSAVGIPKDLKLDAAAISGVTSAIRGSDTVIHVNLASAMGAQVSLDGRTILVRLLKPTSTDSRLFGKVVVVDPGHGGKDRGAHNWGVNEKDLNLSIGRQLYDKLARAGATVIITRNSDVFIPLETRSDISNRTHADFFLSCHINSTGGDGSQSGTITFHHAGNDVGRQLADCIQHQIARVNGLPNLGVWSDGRIYHSGFSVLRNTRAPASVLIEMGFINHPVDLKRMVTAQFQDSVTSAIVRGVRDFLGDASNG